MGKKRTCFLRLKIPQSRSPHPSQMLALTAVCLSTVKVEVQRTSHGLFSGRGFFIRAAAVGNAGFDPLGIASSDRLVPLRHAEVKHGRLAMLAVLAIPAQESFHPLLAKLTGCRNMLSYGLSPSVLNGGLDKPELGGAFAIGAFLMAVVEFQATPPPRSIRTWIVVVIRPMHHEPAVHHQLCLV